MKESSETMLKAVDMALRHGSKLFRHPGGYWAGESFDRRGEYYGTTTVHTLVSRGTAVYSDWKKSGTCHFPVEITLSTEYLEEET